MTTRRRRRRHVYGPTRAAAEQRRSARHAHTAVTFNVLRLSCIYLQWLCTYLTVCVCDCCWLGLLLFMLRIVAVAGCQCSLQTVLSRSVRRLYRIVCCWPVCSLAAVIIPLLCSYDTSWFDSAVNSHRLSARLVRYGSSESTDARAVG